MEQIKNLLNARENKLLELKVEKEKALKTAPEGTLRICSHGGRTQYYQRNDPKDFSGTYIKEKDMDVARKLAQKDYDRKVLCAIEKELSAIQKYSSIYPEINAEQVYENLHKERQKIIVPIMEDDEKYIYEWENIIYQGKPIYEDVPEFYTAKGERVRSKSEVMIADFLAREGIPYRYEYPLYLKGIGVVYPDFTILNVRERKELFWEHLGKMDDSNYAEKAIYKIANYEQNGIFVGEKLILTYETKRKPLNQNDISRMIHHYLQ